MPERQAGPAVRGHAKCIGRPTIPAKKQTIMKNQDYIRIEMPRSEALRLVANLYALEQQMDTSAIGRVELGELRERIEGLLGYNIGYPNTETPTNPTS